MSQLTESSVSAEYYEKSACQLICQLFMGFAKTSIYSQLYNFINVVGVGVFALGYS